MQVFDTYPATAEEAGQARTSIFDALEVLRGYGMSHEDEVLQVLGGCGKTTDKELHHLVNDYLDLMLDVLSIGEAWVFSAEPTPRYPL